MLRFRKPRLHARCAAPAYKPRTSMKFFRGEISRNPLKRLDSDERIQGYPRESNGDNLGF
jgi:hypothetical protein